MSSGRDGPCSALARVQSTMSSTGEERPPWRRYTAALVSVLGRSALPYGYTIAVWTSGAVLEHDLGSPGIGAIWLFLAGAIAAFAALAALSAFVGAQPEQPGAYQLVHTGMVQVIAVGAALGATCVIGLIHTIVAWPLASFAVTAVYLAVAALEVRVVVRVEGDQ